MKLKEETWRRLSYALIAVIGLVMLATFRDYGVTVDEEVQAVYGDKVLAWYSSFFRDRRALDFTFTYGGFFEAVAQLFARILPFGMYEGRHLVNSMFGLVGIIAAYKLGKHIAGAMAGFFAALFLALTPMYYCHSFNNSKDLPYAALFLVSLYFIIVAYDHLPQLPKSLIVKTGISIGLTIAVRVGGLMLFGYLAAICVACLIARLVIKREDAAEDKKKIAINMAVSFIAIVIIAWVVMLIFWPWAQIKPMVNPFRALSDFIHFNMGIKSFFEGELIRDSELPWHYLPTWVSISLPEFYFIALAAGVALGGVYVLRFKKSAEGFVQLTKVGMVAMGAFLPLAMAIVMRPKLYDAARHFLFLVPPMAVLAAVSFPTLVKSRAALAVKLIVCIPVVSSIGITIFDMAELHPYQYVYFNRAVAGGMKAASERFETDYWGSANKEGAEWVINNYRPETSEPVRVANCSGFFMTAYYFNKSEEARGRFVPVGEDDSPHLYIATTRYKCHEKRRWRGNVLHVVERKGVPLLYVIELPREQCPFRALSCYPA